MTPTLIAVLITGPWLPEPHLSLHTTQEQADRALVAAADKVWREAYGYDLSPVVDSTGRDLAEVVTDRLITEGFYVLLREQAVEL